MKTRILLLFSIYFIWSKTVEAQLIQGGPRIPPAPPVLPTSAQNTPTIFAPKCYPETATAYFLPAPPLSPKITVLDPKSDIASNFNPILKEVSSRLPPALPNMAPKRPSVAAPTPTVLPELKDEIPSLIHNKISRLTESDDKVCNACAMIAKLPIYNFDQELLNGFLAGIGL